MDQIRLNTLIDKLADNTINEQELQELLYTIQHTSEADPLLDQALQRLQELPVFPHLVDSDRAKATYASIKSDKRFIHAKQSGWPIPAIAAACIALCIISSLAIFYFDASREASPVIQETLAQQSWSVPLGKREQVTLPDGSLVWINAGSTLSIPSSYNEKVREVYLTGEAYFDVKANKARPFLVKTGTLTTKVLGTAFNINTFDPNKIAFTVQNGKVAVQHQQEDLSVLTGNQQLLYNPKTKSKQLLSVNALDAIGWTHNKLKFDDTSLEEAGKILARWTNKTFIYRNASIKTCHFTVSFHEGESLEEMLTVISALNNFSYEIKGNTVYLDGRGCE